MRTRIIAVAVAAVLAIGGAVALVVAWQDAVRSASGDVPVRTVLVVAERIPAGTPAERLGERIQEREIPLAHVAQGAVADRSALDGLVALVALEPGEQVLAARWGSPTQLTAAGGRVEVPAGLQEVSLALDLPRVAGGAVVPGREVGVWASRDGATALLHERVLVTALASTVRSADAASSTQGTVLVTFAVSAEQAQSIIEAAEYGRIWLTLQEPR